MKTAGSPGTRTLVNRSRSRAAAAGVTRTADWGAESPAHRGARMSVRAVPLGPLLIASAVVAAVVGAVRSDPEFANASLLLGAVAGLFLLVLNAPAWVLAPMLLVEFALAHY